MNARLSEAVEAALTCLLFSSGAGRPPDRTTAIARRREPIVAGGAGASCRASFRSLFARARAARIATSITEHIRSAPAVLEPDRGPP